MATSAPAVPFLRQVFQELTRVTWPTVRELYRYTLVVIATVIVIGTYIFLTDYSLSGALQRFVYTTH